MLRPKSFIVYMANVDISIGILRSNKSLDKQMSRLRVDCDRRLFINSFQEVWHTHKRKKNMFFRKQVFFALLSCDSVYDSVY